MKAYIFWLGLCGEHDMVSIHLSRDKAEYVMESYVEAEKKIWESEHDYEEHHWWDIKEIEIIE